MLPSHSRSINSQGALDVELKLMISNSLCAEVQEGAVMGFSMLEAKSVTKQVD